MPSCWNGRSNAYAGVFRVTGGRCVLHPCPASCLRCTPRRWLRSSRAHMAAAAARLADGTVVTGWNTENAAYPMCVCAEPATLAAAASQRPGMPVVAMAITVKSGGQPLDQPASPCGSCRQQLHEHETRFGQKIRLILRGETGPIFVFASAGDLLPFGFSGDLL
ncbi:MAG: cytidine deaminase [Bacteroidota bacterium]